MNLQRTPDENRRPPVPVPVEGALRAQRLPWIAPAWGPLPAPEVAPAPVGGAVPGRRRVRFGELLVDLLRFPWVRLGPRQLLAEYESAQWLPAPVLADRQAAALRRMAWHCFLHVPFYARRLAGALRPSEIEGLRDATRLPIASATDRRRDVADFRSADPTGEQESAARRVAVSARAERWARGSALPWYGRGEVGLIAAPCDHGGMHVNSDHLLVEIVDRAGRASPPGQVGRILVTDLHNRAAPLVRFDLGDEGRLPQRACPCGRTLTLLEVQGGARETPRPQPPERRALTRPPLRVLAMTKIFPNAIEPLSSPFNRQQFAALGRLCHLEVLATIPWFPGARMFRRWSAAGRLAGVPARETIDGLAISHPRFLLIPKVGHRIAGLLYALSLLPAILRRRRRFDVVLGSWAYPDGYAAVALGRLLGLPVVVKLHGSDINVVATLPGLAPLVRTTLAGADRVIAVSDALRDAAVRLGADPARTVVVGNGVDTELFHPADRAAARAELGLDDAPAILYVGRLEQTKGVIDLLEAFALLGSSRPDIRLLLVGDGGARAECDRAAARSSADGGPARIAVLGARPLAEVPRWMAAADVLVLPSWNEGTPNVVLEAQACGRAVVATAVGGIPALLGVPGLGELVLPHDAGALAQALERTVDGVRAGRFPPRAITAASARADWPESALQVHDLLARVVRGRKVEAAA